MPLCHDFSFILNFSGSLLRLLVSHETLPATTNPYHFWQTCQPVNHAVREQFGLDVITLRCLNCNFADGQVRNLYAQEYRGGDLPDDAHWIERDAIQNLQSPFSVNDLLGWFDSFTSDHPLRRAWYRPGWIEQLPLQAPLEQLRSWERSAIINAGDQYLKAVPPMFGHEPRLTEWLAQTYPADVPALTAVGDDWLLMPDYGGMPLSDIADPAIWAEALRVYAEIQINTPRDTLSALGVPVRGLDWIDSQIDRLMADETALRRGTNPLSDEEIGRLRALAPDLHDACAQLRTAPIPEVLEHGDLWAGQIIVRDGRPLITDWSDSAITFPFFSLPFFTTDIEMPDEPLREAYLSKWSAFADEATLGRIEQIARPLSALYSTLRYYADILPAMENQWEMENMLAYNLRLLLKTSETRNGHSRNADQPGG